MVSRDARACILGQGIQVTFGPSFYTPDAMQYSDNPNDEKQVVIENTASNVALNHPDKNVLSFVDVAGSDGTGDGGGGGTAGRKKRRKPNVAPRGVSFFEAMGSTSAGMAEPAAAPSLVESTLAEIAADPSG